MNGVLVSHPHATPVAKQVAAAFSRAGRLAAFATGIGFERDAWSGRLAAALAGRWPTLRNRMIDPLPTGELRTAPYVELGARAAVKVLTGLGSSLTSYDALFVAHDAELAIARWPKATSAIYAYEDAALATFRRAQRAGIARIWDLPTRHHLATKELWREEMRRWPDAIDTPPHSEPAWKERRKDAELALATTVSVASSYIKSTLERLALRAPIVVTPYGFPIELFQPKPAPAAGPLRVLSVGAHDIPKGTPYLLEAWKQAAIPDAELHLVGSLRLGKSFLDRYAGGFRHSPPLPRAALAAHYAAADVLVFPTLGDGFGLVIQEAMCSATPVITTACSGGPECITDGVDGWLLPARDVGALVEKLRWIAANRDQAAAVGRAARLRAERWTPRDAGDALVRGLEV
ncbi:MAG TPA: glycosyltransferase [Polyangia bacterium]|jgi:glycosyltransferase involved in cell wall biosynthesis